MFDIILESLLAILVGIIFYALLSKYRINEAKKPIGLLFIIYGFALIFFAMLIDITDNFPELNKYIIIGDTPCQAFLKKVVGYFVGFAFLAIGFWKWLPFLTELKKSEENIQKSQERIELALKGAGLGMWDYNIPLDKWIFDERSVELLGTYIQNDAELDSLIHPDDLKRYNETWDAVVKGRESYFVCEYRRKTPSGHYRWFIDQGKIVEWDSNGEPIRATGTMQDITERKEAEAVFRETTKRLELSLQGADLGMWGWDLVEDSFILDYRALEIVGFDPVDVNTFYNHTHPDDLETIRAANNALIEGRCDYLNYDWRIVTSSEEMKWLHCQGKIVEWSKDGKPIRVFGTIQNITKRKKADDALQESEKALRQSEKHLSTLISNAPGSIYRCRNDKKWTKEYVSEGTVDIYGYRPDEFFGDNPVNTEDYIHQEDRERVWEEAQVTLHKHKTYFLQYRIATKDNEEKWVSDRGQGIYSETGELLYLQGIVIDITNLKKAEEEKAKLETKLRQSQKMEAIGTLAGGIAHDFNNILFPIVGYSEMLMQDVSLNSQQHKQLKGILTSAVRATDLVKQILTFSRQTEQELQPLMIQLVIKESLELLRASLPSTIKIRQNLDKHCSMVMADPTHIHQIAMNLITNAFHAMEENGGILDVSLIEVKLSVEDLINPEMMPGNYACLTISDTGIGMDKTTASQVFDPYFTTKGVGKGTGLGMSVVHGIAKNYNGDIRVYSEPGKGTTFRVYLPVVDAEEEATKATAPEAVPGGTERILLVDDEQLIVEMYTQTLEQLGYDVTPHTSSVSALEAIKSSPESFDLVITDMTMPDMTGVRLSQEIMAIRPDMPIILCTGFSKQINEENAKAIGIRGYVMKPVIKSGIAKKIRELLDKNETNP